MDVTPGPRLVGCASFAARDGKGAMKKKVPAAIMVIAVLHFVFGAFGALATVSQSGGVAGVVQQFRAPGKPAQQVQFEQDTVKAIYAIPGWRAFETSSVVIGAVIVVVLIVCGIGLLNMQYWAFIGSIAYAIIDIIVSLAQAVYFFGFAAGPLNAGIQEAAVRNGIGDPNSTRILQLVISGTVGAGAICSLVYPVTVLLVLLLPNVRRSFRSGPVPASDELPEEGLQRLDDDYLT
jgi:hypothetical protein